MGVIIDIIGVKHSWNNNGQPVINRHNGLTLTKTGWKILNVTKHRRDSDWGSWSECLVCKERCSQSFGNQYGRICLRCSPEWLENSIEEMDRIKEKLEEQKELIKKNLPKMMIVEKLILDKWDKLSILEKLESEE